MNVLITGATGLVGRAAIPSLIESGYDITALVRSKGIAGIRNISWDPVRGKLDPANLENVHAVIHLAGESIIGRWTKAKKARIRETRVEGTRLLAEAIARMKEPPRVFVSASAVGFYGDRGEAMLDEQSSAGSGFLAEVCQAWEMAAAPAKLRGTRTVHLRFGIILSRQGGALQKMLLPFQLGLGGPLGNGKQYWSWVALEDAVGVIGHALSHESVSGPVNCVSPNPVTNALFTKVLARVLHRPAFAPVPRFAARALLGEMADALLFSSARVTPRALEESGYRFRFSELDAALRYILSEQQGRA